ncbi:hypothetical protein [Oceanobacillus halotolerans]|uniref:hypothetical protein n=1 Tax=Oceanobacillus halotolerans TaxID=2663380 RepID=UPI001CF7E86C|nr:hypothetical protein [Oceanobacillus halotolerans]
MKKISFVGGRTFANGITFSDYRTETIVQWIEKQTGLIYGKQFELHKEEEGEFHFKECIDGIAVSRSGLIDIDINKEGRLIKFSVHGNAPANDMVREETYTLSLQKVEQVGKKQLKLIEFPSHEKKWLIPIYGIDEIYITNDQMATIPLLVDERSYWKIDKTLYWDAQINSEFKRKEIQWLEEVTLEQAFSNEPSPDSLPITEKEKEKCIIAVKDVLRQEYPNESGKWVLKTLHRDKGYIHATLRTNKQDDLVFQRKLIILVDAKSLQPINYIDNHSMLEMFGQFQEPDQAVVTKNEAYDKIKSLFELCF